jgi:YgiT-type zinc finger domain-containing protein
MSLCDRCGGELTSGYTEIEYKYRGQRMLFENVPAQVCDQCGEVYLASVVACQIDRALREDTPPARTITVPVFEWDMVVA